MNYGKMILAYKLLLISYRCKRRLNINWLKCAENGFINNEEGD